MAGYGLQHIYQSDGIGRWVAALGAAAAIGVASFQAVTLSFQKYDDDTQAYVYAHTRRDFLSLVDEINDIAAASPAGNNIGIIVMSPEHWPLPWYLRNYPRTLYSGRVIETPEPVLVVHESQVGEVEQVFGGRYRQVSHHELRPGNVLYLYVKQ
jgi:predicted membrane-bound mannosyltransferase